MKLALVAAFLMLLGIAGILVTTLLHVNHFNTWDDNDASDYAILLDAGSTETRAYIYTWPHQKNNFPLPSIVIATDDENGPITEKVKPGLATFAGNNAGIKDYLQPLLDWAHQQIDHIDGASAETTNIYLMGTGGMRELSSTDIGAILSTVSLLLQDSGFNYQSQWAQILDGELEAFYGFVSVNTLYNNFADNQDQENTYGSLDMGGVSAEIAFVQSGTPPLNYSITQDINGTRYTVYVQSQDGLGLNAARYAYNVSLYLTQNQSFVDDPCLPSNFTENVTTWINGELTSFLLYGTSQAGACLNNINSFVSSLTEGLQKPTIGDTTFVVSDKYLKVKDFYNLEDNANLLQLRAAAGSFCGLNYEDALSHHPDHANEVPHACFSGTYVMSLLSNFYGLDTSSRHILWKDNVKTFPVSWTLGAMVDKVITAPSDFSPSVDATHHHTRFLHTDAGVVILFISILVFLLGLILFAMQRKRDSEYTMIGSSS